MGGIVVGLRIVENIGESIVWQYWHKTHKQHNGLVKA